MLETIFVPWRHGNRVTWRQSDVSVTARCDLARWRHVDVDATRVAGIPADTARLPTMTSCMTSTSRRCDCEDVTVTSWRQRSRRDDVTMTSRRHRVERFSPRYGRRRHTRYCVDVATMPRWLTSREFPTMGPEFPETPRAFRRRHTWRQRQRHTWRQCHDVTAMSRRRRGIIDGIFVRRRRRQMSRDNWTPRVRRRDANRAVLMCTGHAQFTLEPTKNLKSGANKTQDRTLTDDIDPIVSRHFDDVAFRKS